MRLCESHSRLQDAKEIMNGPAIAVNDVKDPQTNASSKVTLDASEASWSFSIAHYKASFPFTA